MFGTVDTSNKLSDDSGLLPEDLSESRPPAPAPSKLVACLVVSSVFSSVLPLKLPLKA